MDIKVGEHRMDIQGKVWKIQRLKNQCAYVRTPDLILDDHREERAFTQHQVLGWPVVQIQPVPEVPAEAPPPKAQPDVRWSYNRNTQILLAEIVGDDDVSIETIRCFLRIAQADDRSYKAIDMVLHQLNAQVAP